MLTILLQSKIILELAWVVHKGKFKDSIESIPIPILTLIRPHRKFMLLVFR